MPDSLLARMAWCLRNYKNAAQQGRSVSSDVQQTAADALREYDVGLRQDAEDAPEVEARLDGTKIRSW